MNHEETLQAQNQNPLHGPDGIETDKTIAPGSPEPLSPGRTTLHPDDEPGVDELPNNEGQTPLDSNDDARLKPGMTDIDTDNAEMDDQPNPR